MKHETKMRYGAATSFAKVNHREGVSTVRIGHGEVTDGELRRSIADGARYFWAKRAWLGKFCDGPTFEGQMRAAAQRKACA